MVDTSKYCEGKEASNSCIHKNIISSNVLYFFRSVMPRDRFLQIFWNLHLCDPNMNSRSPRNAKVQPLLDLLVPVFQSKYVPGQHIAVDESMIGFKGKVSFRQYIRGKPHPFGINAFVHADSKTGYLHNVRIYLVQTLISLMTLVCYKPLEQS